MNTMLYNKNQMLKKKTLPILVLVTALAVIGLFGVFSTAKVLAAPTEVCPDGTTISGGDCSTHQNTTDRNRCRNGATIPDSYKAANTEEVFCKDNGGYLNSPNTSGQDPNKCKDGTSLPISGPTSAPIPPEEFCASHGGYTNPTSGTTPAPTTPAPTTPTGSTSNPPNSNTTGPVAKAPDKICGEVIKGTPPPADAGTTDSKAYYCIDDKTADSSLGSGCRGNYSGNAENGCGIVQRYVTPLIKFLSIGMGVVVTVMIAIGGVQYATAAGDPQQVAVAKKRIFNSIFALVAFGLLYGFLSFIIPGGL